MPGGVKKEAGKGHVAYGLVGAFMKIAHPKIGRGPVRMASKRKAGISLELVVHCGPQSRILCYVA